MDDKTQIQAVAQKQSDAAGGTITGTKPGVRTTEFWAMALLVLPVVLDEVKQIITDDPSGSPWAKIAAGIAAGAYAIARALAKRPA